MQIFYARGKLLLSGEYTVLKGAKALVLPSRYGQHLRYRANEESHSYWRAVDHKGASWFEAKFDDNLKTIHSTDQEKAQKLAKILAKAEELSGKSLRPFSVETHLEFAPEWGLGSSSTLYSLIAQLHQIDGLKLYRQCGEKGSGYDVAIAGSDYPAFFRKDDLQTVHLPEVFQNSFFVYLNQKQDSSVEVKRFLEKDLSASDVRPITELTNNLVRAREEQHLQGLLREHEELTAGYIGAQPVQERLFPDYSGTVKSLGAWGGDFVWVVGGQGEEYFKQKGFSTVLKFPKMATDQVLNTLY